MQHQLSLFDPETETLRPCLLWKSDQPALEIPLPGPEASTDDPDENAHEEEAEDDLEDVLDVLVELILEERAKHPMKKAWSATAREAATAARSKAGRLRSQAAEHTGLRHRDMNKQGFIRTETIQENPLLLSRARDHNDARADFLTKRKHFINIIRGNKEGDAKAAAHDYKRAGQRMSNTGAYFRIANNPG